MAKQLPNPHDQKGKTKNKIKFDKISFLFTINAQNYEFIKTRPQK